jgi:antitoxin HicB
MSVGYPAVLTPDDGNIIIEFPDVPEAISSGRNEDEALLAGREVLILALAEYMARRREIPSPSAAEPGRPVVVLPPLVAAKLALYAAMRRSGVTQVELARRLAMDGKKVRRLLDLEHRSRIDQLDAAFAALGKRLVLAVEDAA